MTGPAPDRPLRTVSLRRRVAVWVLLVLVVSMASLALVVNWLLGDALRSDLRQRLEDKASYAAVLQEQGVNGQALADRLAGAGVFSSFTSGNNRYIGHDSDPPAGAPLGAGGPPGSGGPRPGRPKPAVEPTVTFSESDGRLTATVVLEYGTLTLSTTEADISTTLSRLQHIEWIAGAAVLLVAGLVVVTVVRAALRPLERMSGLAKRIRDGTRGRRLRPTKPGTDLGRTAAAFDDMLDALESAEAQAQAAEVQMRQFLADASHDLRTPLAGVIAGSEQLLRNPGSRAEREERLVQVVRQARRAARLIDDLLLMTRLDAAAHADAPASTTELRIKVRPVDPLALIDREACLLKLRRPDLTVRMPDGPSGFVLSDPDQLQRAFGNLLDNAAAVSAPGGTIRIERWRNDDEVRIRVIDDGPGVPENDRERIFDRFVRLSTSRSGPGSGLGLPISRALVRAEGGELRCLPWQGGACFEVALAAAVAPSPERSRVIRGSMSELPQLSTRH